MKIPGSRLFNELLTRSNRRGIILMYHRIADLEYDPWCLNVSPANFEQQIQVIKKYGKPVAMGEMEKSLKNYSFGKNEIVLSFDDGYADNFKNAKPILEKHGVPAVFYIVSGAVNGVKEFWWDEIVRIVFTAKSLPDSFEMVINGKKYEWTVCWQGKQEWKQHASGTYKNNTELSRVELHYAIWEAISHLSLTEKWEVLKEVALWAGQPSGSREENRAMNSQELTSLAISPIAEIGAHTIRHPMLTTLALREQEEEIGRSKSDLENLIGRRITSFSYPHGDYSNETLEIVDRLKFTNACTVDPRPVQRNENPYLLPRLMVLNWTAEQFEKQLCDWLGRGSSY